MIEGIHTVSIFVADQDRAKAFYRDVLGFEVRADNPLYPGATQRWLSVGPPGEPVSVILYRVDENWKHYRSALGRAQNVTFQVDDLEATHAQLTDNGAEFATPPTSEPWGRYATVIDSEGNRLLLIEPA